MLMLGVSRDAPSLSGPIRPIVGHERFELSKPSGFSWLKDRVRERPNVSARACDITQPSFNHYEPDALPD